MMTFHLYQHLIISFDREISIVSFGQLFLSNNDLDYSKSSIFYGPTNYEMRLDKLFVKTFQPKQRTLR